MDTPALRIVADALATSTGGGADREQPSAMELCAAQVADDRPRPAPLVNFVDTEGGGNTTAAASPRSFQSSRRSGRSPTNSGSVGSPRTGQLRRIREQREKEELARSALAITAGGPLVALQHALRLSTLLQFDAPAEARQRGAADESTEVRIFHGLRVLKAAVKQRVAPPAAQHVSKPESDSLAQSRAAGTAASPRRAARENVVPPPPPLSVAEERAWSAALQGFSAMRAKGGSAAATFPALTYFAVVVPVAIPTLPEAVGLTTIWEAARDECKPRREALRRKAERERLEQAREHRETPLPVRFAVKAPLTLPSAPYTAVPWLEMLVDCIDDASARDPAEARRNLGLIVESAMRPKPRRVNVQNLRALFDVSTKRQPGEPDPAAVPLDGSRSTFRASHSAKRAALRKQKSQSQLQRGASTVGASTQPQPSSSSNSLVVVDDTPTSNANNDDDNDWDAVPMAHRFLVPPTRLTALEMLIHIEDPPLHPEPFCAAPATLKAMAMKKAIRENAKPEPTPLELAQAQATRAASSASSSRLAALLRAKDEKTGVRPKSRTPQPGEQAVATLPAKTQSRRKSVQEATEARHVASTLRALENSGSRSRR